ncbi:MAG: 4-(cytidine 5'-diphospho)-2-C-methyl-D-erythritol kinase [Candidatus Omnitrophica bacterium]|nr:4-(cytidine 5'-diphospho)-2-C-methyl-D-erythritol kinase [Candidatus Omnitrophota bacterium]
MKQIQILAPAKINLFLKILNKRKDDYHNIETIFEKVSLFDKIILRESPKNDVIIESNVKDLRFLGKSNTVYKAIHLIKKRLRVKRGIYAYVEKSIPIGAGLGGGSSDAVATLKGINRLWRLGLCKKDLLNLSKNIGSDVPLFMLNGSFLLGKGRGEELSRIPGTSNLKLWHILVVPNLKISTHYAYSLFDKYYLSKKRGVRSGVLQGKLRLTIPTYSANIITYALLNRDVSLLNYYSYNSFKSLILREFTKLSSLNRILENINRDFVHLSGSGSALFMTFSDRKEAEYPIRKIKKVVSKCNCFLVHTC